MFIFALTKIIKNTGIISRASAAGNLYDDDFEHDSISNCGSKKHEWNLPNDNNIVAVVSNHMSLNPQIIKVN